VSEHDNNLKGMEVGEYISILEQENEELRIQVRFANKITDHYQKELVPGYRERAHKAEQQAAAYREALEAWQSIYSSSFCQIGKCPKCGRDTPSISHKMCWNCALELTNKSLSSTPAPDRVSGDTYFDRTEKQL
jgi:hypothetical protein